GASAARRRGIRAGAPAAPPQSARQGGRAAVRVHRGMAHRPGRRTSTGMRTHVMRFALALAAVVALEIQPARAALSDAATVAHDLNASLLEVMKNAKTLGYAGRVEKIGPIIDRAFDVPFMAEKVIGRHWDTLNDADRKRWVGLFREFLIANYAGRFNA